MWADLSISCAHNEAVPHLPDSLARETGQCQTMMTTISKITMPTKALGREAEIGSDIP